LKPAGRLIALAFSGLLVACAGEKDNSEPPSPLTDIEDKIALKINWKLKTKAAANEAAYPLRPLLIGDRVYSIDTAGLVTSIDAASGDRLWKFKTELAAITGLGGDEQVLIATSEDGEIAAYQKSDDGLEFRWKILINSEIRATPVVDNKQIFVRSVDGKLRSLAVADGSEQWVVSRRVPVLSLTGNSQPLVQGELVFAGFDDGKLIAYNRNTGQVRWETAISLPSGRTEVERLVDIDGHFVMRDGVIYVASFQGRLAAVQAVSGDLLWSREFSNFQAITIDDDALYLSAENSDLWAVDRRTGTAFWKQDVLHARKITAPSIVADKLVVADFAGYLHWFDKADGNLVGRIQISESRNFVKPLTWNIAVLTMDKSGLLASVSPRQ